MLNSYLGKKVNTLRNQSALYDSLLTHDIDGLLSGIKTFFASIPYNWHTNNNIAHYEGYWASVFYALFASLGFTTIAEDSTSQGSVHMALLIGNHVYVFEFKVISKKTNQPTGVALNQIHTKQYADKYRSKDKIIHKIGVEFNEKTKEVMFEVDKSSSEVF
ncbi:PD-(D/E)XK nuclease domain-containing protein [Moraxella lacunata]|nr:PD-(D/E)XK nuclease domain-containing protein [Moraxella lacunata]